jgi:hypothetical protein
MRLILLSSTGNSITLKHTKRSAGLTMYRLRAEQICRTSCRIITAEYCNLLQILSELKNISPNVTQVYLAIVTQQTSCHP